MATGVYAAFAAGVTALSGAENGVKILHILGDSKYGGAAKSILRLAQTWDSAGWRARILTSDPAFQRACVDAGIPYANVDCIWRKIRPIKDLVGLIRLWRFLRNEKVTIVHTHTTKAGFIGRIAARLAGVPIVVHTIHGFAFHERSSRVKIAFYTVLEKIAGACCQRIITVSRFHKDWALKLRIAGADKLQAIPNGTPDVRDTPGAAREEVRKSLGVPDGDILLLTPGRLALEKGLQDLLAAVAATRGRLSRRLHVALAGDGPLLPLLEHEARTLGLTDQVRFLGFRSDIGNLLSAADIVALPSLREGLSIALLEAMSAGRAIIATSIGSNLEAAGGSGKDGPVAFIIEAEDRRALTDAIVQLAGDACLRKDLGEKARYRWQQRYTADQTLAAHHEAYRDLLKRKCLDSKELCLTGSSDGRG